MSVHFVVRLLEMFIYIPNICRCPSLLRSHSGVNRVVLASLFPHLLGSLSLPVALRRQLGVSTFNQTKHGGYSGALVIQSQGQFSSSSETTLVSARLNFMCTSCTKKKLWSWRAFKIPRPPFSKRRPNGRVHGHAHITRNQEENIFSFCL